MSKRLRIVFVDDQPQVAQSAADQLPQSVKDGADIEVLQLADVTAEVNSLFRRYRLFLDGKSFAEAQAAHASRFDGADLLILDYDLKNTSDGGEWASGLEVARTARAFTTALSVVLLNQFRSTSRFDLTMTEGRSSFADLDIPRLQLSNPGLWSGAALVGFRPWSWPNLLLEPSRFQLLARWVADNIDRPVLDALSLNTGAKAEDDPANTIPRESWAMAMSSPDTTFRQLIEKAGFVPPHDSEQLMNDPDAAPRIAASVFAHWFDRYLCLAQDVFVDTAHLAHLAPWLLKDPASMDLRSQASSLELEAADVFLDDVKKFMLEPNFISSRRLFRYNAIQADRALAKPAGFSFSSMPDVVFCEDVSNFIHRKLALPFPSLLPGGYSVRFVCNQDEFRDDLPEVQNPHKVDYAPQSLFAL